MILAEHKLASTGLIDPATAKKLGQIVGADALVTGTMTPFSETVRVAVKVLATDTASIVSADTIDLPKTSTIAELLGNKMGARESAPVPPYSSRSNPEPSSPRPSAIPSNPIVMDGELAFELLGCKGIATSVTCSFRLTTNRDGRVGVFCKESYNTRAFDNFGNQDSSVMCTIANKDYLAELVANVPVSVSLQFSGFSAAASSLPLITIVGVRYEMSSLGYTVSFRNVPITR